MQTHFTVSLQDMGMRVEPAIFISEPSLTTRLEIHLLIGHSLTYLPVVHSGEMDGLKFEELTFYWKMLIKYQ